MKMMRKLFFICIILVLSTGAQSASLPPPTDVLPLLYDSVGVRYTEEHSTMADTLPGASNLGLYGETVNPFVIGLEVAGLNVLVWAWDRYVLDKNYARVTPKIWHRNLREGWEWDHNHWAINFYGHPLQGTYYYVSGRSGGYGFYRSLIWAALGSYTWEMFAETEYPSINDLIMTSVGGSVYGEVLYRLCRKLYGIDEAPWYKQLINFGVTPTGYLQRKIFGNRDGVTGNTPLGVDLFLGTGSHFGNSYRFGHNNADELDNRWDDSHGAFELNLVYGRPYTKVKNPFDYFTMIAGGQFGEDGSLVHLDIMGKLNNVGAHGRGHWVDFATYLDYDTFYGDFATIGTISLGGGLDLAIWLLPKTRFRLMNQVYWTILGTTDMGYDDIIKEVHPEYESDKDNYQYNMGVKYCLNMELWLANRFTISNRLNLQALHTMPNSIPHYGAYGWDFLIFNYTDMVYDFNNWIGLGTRLETYVKLAAYSTELFEPMSRRMFTFTLYLTFKLL